MRVMITDDSPMIHKLLKKMVEEAGHEVCFIAENGKEAVENVLKVNPDLIFMDITMPVMEGIEAVKKIREMNVNVPVVFLSALGDDKTINSTKSLGIAGFLTKPFRKEDLFNLLKKVEGENA